MRKSKFNLILITAAIAVMVIGISLPTAIEAQTNKIVPPVQMLYSTSTSTNDVQLLSKVQPKQLQFSAEKTGLLKQLDIARTNNDVQSKERIESRLNEINGTKPVQLIENPNVRGGAVSGFNKAPFQNQSPDYLSTLIYNAGIWSSAVQTVGTGYPNAGRVWAGVTIYSSTGGDTCKFFYSDNGGQSWTYAYIFYFTGNTDFRSGELDFEVAYDGTDEWIYGVAGYADLVGNRTYSLLFRFNLTTNAFAGYTLLWPGNATTTNLYYNPRITTDNTNYTSATYMYLGCSFDSTYSSNLHVNRQKYAHIINPFVASPTIDYSQPGNVNNGGFYWNSSGVPAGTYLWTDIAYTHNASSVNRVYTVYNVPGSSNYNIYVAYSDDYGATSAGSSIANTNVDYGARLAFNGGTNTTGMIALVRQFSGTDWDSYYFNTTDGGATWPTSGYIDGSSNRARTVDIIAVRSANNLYRVGYDQDSASGNFAFYVGGNGSGWNSPSRLAISPTGSDSTFTKVIAGYRNGGGDDCFALYSMGSGTGTYSSRLCQSTVGVGNNNQQVPNVYSLSQNFPNPFNPATEIKFSIPGQSFVKLVVYDINGNEVATLVNNEKPAGNYSVKFDATNFASGIYFYKLTAGSFESTKKMALVK
ncbi:MAG: T9SS type A sorting domain-containing protein [Ignavibacteria bacterium]